MRTQPGRSFVRRGHLWGPPQPGTRPLRCSHHTHTHALSIFSKVITILLWWRIISLYMVIKYIYLSECGTLSLSHICKWFSLKIISFSFLHILAFSPVASFTGTILPLSLRFIFPHIIHYISIFPFFHSLNFMMVNVILFLTAVYVFKLIFNVWISELGDRWWPSMSPSYCRSFYD